MRDSGVLRPERGPTRGASTHGVSIPVRDSGVLRRRWRQFGDLLLFGFNPCEGFGGFATIASGWDGKRH